MAPHIILLVCSHAQCLQERYTLIRAAGHWPLSAPSLSRAVAVTRKIRPDAVVVDVELADGRGVELLREMRSIPYLHRVHVVLLGILARDEHHHVMHDPYVHVRQLEDEEISPLLDEIMSGKRPAEAPFLSSIETHLAH